MDNLILLAHSDTTEEDLREIIKIKSVAWPYTYDEHKQWMKDNLNDSVIHVLLSKDNIYVAYLNLIRVDLLINGKSSEGLGVGNVCSVERGKGWGRELMMLVDSFIEQSNKVGLLFCKEELVGFYTKCHWQIIDRKKQIVPFSNDKIKAMLYNYYYLLHELQYNGRLF
jgi:hypothetical protein